MCSSSDGSDDAKLREFERMQRLYWQQTETDQSGGGFSHINIQWASFATGATTCPRQQTVSPAAISRVSARLIPWETFQSPLQSVRIPWLRRGGCSIPLPRGVRPFHQAGLNPQGLVVPPRLARHSGSLSLLNRQSATGSRGPNLARLPGLSLLPKKDHLSPKLLVPTL